MWWYASSHRRLLDPGTDAAAIAGVSRRYTLGVIGYVAAFLLSFINAVASLGLIVLLGLMFVLPSSSGGVTATPPRSETEADEG